MLPYHNQNMCQAIIHFQIIMYRSDGIEVTMMQLGKSLAATLEAESDSNVHTLHRPHEYGLRPLQRCEDNHAFCTGIIVDFTRDHGRLAITKMTMEHFHTKQRLGEHGLLFYWICYFSYLYCYSDNGTWEIISVFSIQIRCRIEKTLYGMIGHKQLPISLIAMWISTHSYILCVEG